MAIKVTKRGKNGQNACAENNVPTPPAVAEPRKLRRPKSRDIRAFLLQGQGMNQRQIADELGCDQATVSRALARYHLWFGKSLPEDRGPMTSGDVLNVEMERHRIFLEHAQSLALTAYYRSCQTQSISKTREKVYPERRKAGGDPVKETQTDKYDKEQYGHVASLNAAVRISHERLVLAAGWVGPGNGCISLMQAMDPDERDRWQRMVKDRDARIDELTAERAAAKALPIASPAESASNFIKTSSAIHHHTPAEIAANPVEEVVCAELVEPAQPPVPLAQEIPKVHQSVGSDSGASRVESKELAPEPKPTYRWEDKYRQEALDYHCLKFNLPPASLEQATGIPDPFKISPRLWMERGYPYMISIDRSIPCDRENPLERNVIRLQTPIVLPCR